MSERVDITDMTTSEINKLIFGDAEPWEHVSMPFWVAEQVIEMDHVDRQLKDWAWTTIDAALIEEGV